MNIKHKLKYLFAYSCIGAAAIGAIACVTVVKQTFINEIYSQQKHALEIVRDVTAKSTAVPEQEPKKDASSYINSLNVIINNLRGKAELIAKTSNYQNRAIDFLSINYFSNNADQSQIFSSKEFPKVSDCLQILDFPADAKAELSNFLKNQKDSEKLVCYLYEGNKYIGYVLPDVESSKNQHYVYLEKFQMTRDDYEYKTEDTAKTQETAKKELPPINIAVTPKDKQNGDVFAIFDKEANLVVSSVPDFNFDPLTKELLRSSQDDIVQTEIYFDKEYLTSILRLPDQDYYAVNLVPKKRIVQIPYFMAGGIALLFILLIPVGISFLRKYEKYAKKQAEKATKVIKSIEDVNLFEPATINGIAESLSNPEKSDFSNLQNSISGLCKDLGEKLPSMIEEISSKNFKEGTYQSEKHMQVKMLPISEDLPNSRFLDIASYLIQSKHSPANDFYDLYRIDKDNIAFVLISSMEKGVACYKPVIETNALIRKCVFDEGKRPGETLTIVNAALARRNHDKVNLRVFLILLSEFTGNYIASNAGFTYPVQVHLHTGHLLTQSSGPAIGKDPNRIYDEFKGKLDFSDLLCMYTPGISELKNAEDELFGTSKVIEICEEKADSDSATVLTNLNKKVQLFAKDTEITSDMTAICIIKSKNNKEFA